MKEKIIFTTDNFKLSTYETPHLARSDGGHIVITPNMRVSDRLELSPELAVEMSWLTQLAGDAMTTALRKQGIDIGLINYQDNKNWGALKPEGPFLHVHLYGRSRDAKDQKYGETLEFPRPETGHYDSMEPLNNEDVVAIRSEIDRLLLEDKYQKSNWHM